jgi:hypothetical protein
MYQSKLLLILLISFIFTACASYLPTGALYTEVKAPISVATDGDLNYTKVGEAKATSIFGLVATGDASLEAAMRNGNIKRVKHVEYQVKNILGFGENKTIVYGD